MLAKYMHYIYSQYYRSIIKYTRLDWVQEHRAHIRLGLRLGTGTHLSMPGHKQFQYKWDGKQKEAQFSSMPVQYSVKQ